MKGSTSLLLLLICLTYVLALPSQLHYEVNDESQFTLQSSLDARGHLSTNGQRTGGSYATLDSTLVTECVQEDSTSYYFVTNLFSTDVNAGQANEEKISRGEKVFLEDDGDDDDDSNALGYDMYYQQTFDGQITNVWYREDDSMFFVNIKLGAINALQTHIVPEGSSKSFAVQDPVGKHTSEFQGAAQTQILTVTETFSQLDVQSFPDPNLSPDNVKIQAQTITKISPYPNTAAGGYISVSNSIQMVDLVNIQKEKSAKGMKGMSDTTALDATLSSLGSLNITMTSFQKPLSSKFKRLQMKDLETNGYIKDSLFGVASKGIQIRPIEKMNNFRVVLESVLMSNWSNPTQDVKSMNKLIKYINGAPQEIQTIEEYMKRLNLMSVSSRKKLLYIVSGLNGMASIDMLIQQGILSKDSQIAIDSIIASNGIPSKNINDRLLLNLLNLAFNGTFTSVNKAATLSLGSSLGRSTDSSLRNRYGMLLLNQLIRSLSVPNSDWLVTVVHAMGNAGPSIPFESIPWNKLLMHGDSRVRLASVGALRKFAHHRDVPTLLQKVLLTESDIRVRATANTIGGKIVPIPQIQDSDFPFNKSWEGSFGFGGEEVNATFSGLLFAGTNFNCNQEYFNYEVQAKADANLVFFDWSKEAALAEILYGKANGQLIGNEIYLRVWDDVIYDQQFPVVDCSEHIYPLYHAEPGISVSYTLWVSVIPVTFTASASAVIDLDWGWQICDDKLSALVELIPEVTIVLDGDAEVFLLIAKAGIELGGSFNAQVRPQGYIAGSNCTVGFDVRFESNPAQFDLGSYYQFHECEYWIFDCSWGDKHTQTWYSWSSQSENKVIFDMNWKITP